MATFNHPKLTGWTVPGKKRVRIRVMVIHLGLRLLQANVQLQKKEMEEIGFRLAKSKGKWRLLCGQRLVSTTTFQIKLLHSKDEPTACRTTADRGEVDYVLRTSMLGAHKHPD